MSDFLTTTPFRLVRRLAAAGLSTPSMYLLVAEAAAIDAVRADLAVEAEIQLGTRMRLLEISDVQAEKLESALAADGVSPLTLLTLDHWAPEFIGSLDRNIVLVARSRTVLLLASMEVGERVLAAAPNLRNRLTDVLAVKPDEALGGADR